MQRLFQQIEREGFAAVENRALRLVAYNDVVMELNRRDMQQPLTLRQRLLAVLA